VIIVISPCIYNLSRFQQDRGTKEWIIGSAAGCGERSRSGRSIAGAGHPVIPFVEETVPGRISAKLPSVLDATVKNYRFVNTGSHG
jgi:hypothetical protein